VQAVQAAHSAIDFQHQHEIAKEWHLNSSYLAILSVANEIELHQLIERAQAKEIKISIYREPDLDNQITAICLAPSIQSKKLCSSIKLALKE
jgi:peptidyl-tRNA hydrolase PTH2